MALPAIPGRRHAAGIWRHRRYRLIGALVAVAALGPLTLAAAPGRSPAEPATHAIRAEFPSAPAVPAEQAASGVTPHVERLRVGDYDHPAAGVERHTSIPRGVPLVGEAGQLRGIRTGRVRNKRFGPTLVLQRPHSSTFSAVGVTWASGSRGQIGIAVRTHVPGGGWRGWRLAMPGTPDRDSAGSAVSKTSRRVGGPAPNGSARAIGRDGADLLWFGPSDGLEIVLAGRAAADIAVDLIDPLTVPGDAAAAESAPAAGSSTGGEPGAGRVGMPPVMRRASWGADERLMTWQPEYAHAVEAVAFHHTATGNDYTPDDVPRLMRAIYYYQAVSRGWGDIGYSVLVDRFGRLWEGRYGGLSRAVVGAHTGGFNRATAGLAVIGDHRTVDVPAPAVESAARYVAWKLSLGRSVDPRSTTTLTGGGSTSRYPPGTTITVPRLFPHRLTNPTECPGDRGMAVLDSVRQRAFQLMGVWADHVTVRMRLATWRQADAHWRVLGTTDPALVGAPGDLPVPADYDGDGVTDLATWTPASATWSIHNSGGGTTEQVVTGADGDRPVPADYDGDGRAEPAGWTPATGVWQIHGRPAIQWGQPGDVPVPGDYDGDGRADLAVWRPGSGEWLVRGVGLYRLGESFHIPVPGDYDGDGKVEPASWSPVSQRWFVWGQAAVRFGVPGDVPVPGQYDGDGRADFAVWRPPASGGGTANWLVRQVGTFAFGAAGDVPTPLP